MSDLAVIIPAFKDEFLYKTLLSFACQTNKDFTVYIGDDNSPRDLKSICDNFINEINIVYHRFEDNLGGTDLVAHWERCVKLIQNEKWIWIFSDDDLADKLCVAAFYDSLAKTDSFFDVYRFNTSVIDRNDDIISSAEDSPEIEDSFSLAYNILILKRGNSMPDHIFKKTVYDKNGGIVNFIQAQGSDWATSIKFAMEKGLYTIMGPKVKWRMSGKNISSIAYKNRSTLIFGHLKFIDWVVKSFKGFSNNQTEIKFDDLISASKFNLSYIIKKHYKGIPLNRFISVAKQIAAIYNRSPIYGIMFSLRINLELYKDEIKKK